MDAGFQRQSRFSRTLANEEKLGAYYTDLGMCRRIANLFNFDSEKKFAILEPSIGNAVAVKAVVGKEDGDSKVLFGVELNADSYLALSSDPQVEYLLNADFLNGITCSNNVFSFCFANPPYGMGEDGTRLETGFLLKITSYLKSAGLLCMVIPDYVFKADFFLRPYLSRYEHLAHYRFDDVVYAQFKQIVIIGRKKPSVALERELLNEMRERVSSTDTYPYLPNKKGEWTYNVPSSDADKVELFTTLKFDADGVYERMRNTSPLYSSSRIGTKTEMAEFCTVSLGNPILPPSPSMCYLMATVGGGAGLCGTEGSLHLQRGCAKTEPFMQEVIGEDGKVKIVETKRTSMRLKIIENDGTIHNLK